MISNVQLDIELEQDIKNLKAILIKYSNIYKISGKNISILINTKSFNTIISRLKFIIFQFKNIYINGNWF